MKSVRSLLKKPSVCMILDWDGTVLKFRLELFLDSMNYALTNTDRDPLKSLQGSKSVRDTLVTDHAYNIFKEHFMSHPITEDMLMPGARELLELLPKLGVKAAVVSNLDHDILLNDVESLGLFEYLSAVRGSQNIAELKPNPAMMLEVTRLFGNSEGFLGVGDTIGDIEAAKAAGIISVHIGAITDAVRRESPDLIFPNLDELAQHIINIQGRGR